MARHVFAPERYYTTMGSHPAELHIAPGDTVVTTTVDARGQDASGQPITPRGNPMTGPFFIEGAEPGDTLVLHLDRLVPNRPTGWSSAVLAPNVVDPEFAQNLPERPIAIWDIDLARGEASLQTPVPGLEALRLPVDPMLGCFGVAPIGGQANRPLVAGLGLTAWKRYCCLRITGIGYLPHRPLEPIVPHETSSRWSL